MAGVTQEKAWFRKGQVCSSLTNLETPLATHCLSLRLQVYLGELVWVLIADALRKLVSKSPSSLLKHVLLATGRLHRSSQTLNMSRMSSRSGSSLTLVAPYRAILRYYRCDTPISRDTFSGRLVAPQNGAIAPGLPPLVLSHIAR